MLNYHQSTSVSQDRLAQAIFRGFGGLVTMSTNHDQFSGLVVYTYNLKSDGSQMLRITVNRLGVVLMDGEL